MDPSVLAAGCRAHLFRDDIARYVAGRTRPVYAIRAYHDHMDEQPAAETPDGGAVFRQWAATFADWAGRLDDANAQFEQAQERHRDEIPDELVAVLDGMQAWMRASAYRLHTTQRLTGEQARAYDEMMAEGGPDNAEAHARYKESTEFRKALLPRDYRGGSIDRP